MTNALLGLFYRSDAPSAVDIEDVEETVVARSHSSDLLKKSPIDPIIKKGHFNSLKQWGKNRLRRMSRSPSASRDSFKESLKTEKSKDSKSTLTLEKENDIQETVTLRKKKPVEDERRLTHQRCASYSSSEKSIGIPSNVPTTTTATVNIGVKLRSSSTQRRLRRSAIGKEELHSSSGNWSASSESGRTSIGSEITTTTIPPKSTTSAATSNNSLNFHNHGPPSSIISRRRFLNTSGSGSVTSEGTLTPDIINDLHEDMETSSEFSCDTEGYYTSFHMDSGLKTLKEEELSPSTPMHTSNALSNSSNSQNMTAENEYELFGKGSTSTTTSSAGTVCTTLMAASSDRSLVLGPTVPERKSSLSKMNRIRGNIHSANASLDRSLKSSFSKSPFNTIRYNTMRSFTDKAFYNNSSPDINEIPTSTITITRNVGNHREMTAVAEIHTDAEIESAKKSTGTSSPDSGHNTSSSPIEDSVSSAHGKNSLSEQDYSESSDLEGTDRIERIRYKTTINSSRIPSLCVITPSNSDDESFISIKDGDVRKSQDTTKLHLEGKLEKRSASRPKLDLPVSEVKEVKSQTDVNKTSNKFQGQINLKNPLQPFNNLMCKLKGVLPSKLSNKKSPGPKETELPENLYDAGDYVTIADVKNNNQKINMNRGVYGNNDIVRKNLQTVLSGKLQETEYVSLNELPNCLNETKDFLDQAVEEIQTPGLDEIHKKGAKVTLDSEGHVVYSSDTLKRRKGAHTTFEPGPFVQEIASTTSVIQRETADIVRISPDETDFPYEPSQPSSKPTSPQLGKVIIKAPSEPNGVVTKEFITMPPPKPSTVITATPITETLPSLTMQQPALSTNKQQGLPRIVDAITRSGAYVNIHDADGISLSPSKDDSTGKQDILSKVITRNNFLNSMQDVDEYSTYSKDIVPFVPNFQTTKMLEAKNLSSPTTGDRVSDLLKIFSANINGDNISMNRGIVKKADILINSKVKRSDSYKLANSPLLPIKKLLKLDSFSINKSKKINSLELIQDEITASLLMDQINYPSTVSPKLGCRDISSSNNLNIEHDKFEAELPALTLSPFTTPLPKRHTVAFVPDCRDTSLDVLTAILDSDPDEVCTLHSPPTCTLSPSKVTLPSDCSMHRARILSLSESDYGTEIW